MPILSVIVPFYNVEKYIGPCLDSLAAQTLRDLEVICVDDGSTDGSPAVVEARLGGPVRLVRQPNQGVGRARNVGVRHASGRYLAFVDGDDRVPPGAFQRLVSSLESTGSDLACGNVMRLSQNQLVPSWAHKRAFAEPARRTHITRHTLLIRDRMLWNKVYRRAFWDRLGLSFPERMYEDQPVAMAAHVGAQSVDVLKQIVYHWRQRDEEGASITQRCLEPDNLRDRLLSVMETAHLLDAWAPSLKPHFDRDTLDIDMTVAAEALAGMGPEADPGLVDLAVRFLDGVSQADWLSIPFAQRVQMHLLRERRLAELAEVFAEQRDGRLRPRVSRAGLLRRRWHGVHPAIPRRLSEVSEELELEPRLTGLSWRDGLLTGAGRVALGSFDATELGRARIDVRLQEHGTGRAIALSSQDAEPTWDSAPRDDGPPTPEHGFAFSFTFDPAVLTSAQLSRQRLWDLRVRLRAPRLDLDARVGGPRWQGPVAPAPERHEGVWLLPVRSDKGRWGLRLRRSDAVLDECRVEGGELRFSGRLRDLGDGEPTVRLVRGSDGEEMYFPVTLTGRDFHAGIPLDDVEQAVGRESCWAVLIDQGRPLRPVVRGEARPEATVGERRFLVDRAADGCLMLVEWPAIAESWSAAPRRRAAGRR
ncbi:glycosyltransferase family 2 protein [Nonomuraea sp. NPDC005983]|uniref:glycosyltransferase family 2 protein n=1 Tax=Nonomuraea sp. NPDC005983 TaxID=3155595 RepID=UPI0033A11B43